MKKILVLGAGRSASSLIKYLLEQSIEFNWEILVADTNLDLAEKKINGHEKAKAIHFDIFDEARREEVISQSDLVISMLPARFHIYAAEACIKFSKNLLTASYVSDDIKALDQQAVSNDTIILMECGLDPGLDHMSAMKVIDSIREKGHKLTAFETFTGGLIAPESEGSNPWKYKFTWNPRNVVLAGQGAVKFIQENRYKYIPYHKLFKRTEIVEIPEYGLFEGYANRDSLKYREVYGLQDLKTLYRGTFRRPGYCRAWNIFVQLGATDDGYMMEDVKNMTHRQFINSFLAYNPTDSVELKLAHYMNLELESEEMFKLKWLGLFEDELVGLDKGTPAQILEHILKKKWAMKEEDIDMIVMWHKFDFLDNGKAREVHSHCVVKGQNSEDTAMSMTVGLPLGIAAKMILNGKIKAKGVQVPIVREIYAPILAELETNGITFEEKIVK